MYHKKQVAITGVWQKNKNAITNQAQPMSIIGTLGMRRTGQSAWLRSGWRGSPGALPGGRGEGPPPDHMRARLRGRSRHVDLQPGHAVDGHQVLDKLVPEGEAWRRAAPDVTKTLVISTKNSNER